MKHNQVFKHYNQCFAKHTYPSSNLEMIMIGPNDSSVAKKVPS